jgi:signal transduction histidine kinase/Tfp pilus assembly protein PilF
LIKLTTGILHKAMLTALLFLIVAVHYAQTPKADSLKKALTTVGSDTSRVNTLIGLCWELRTTAPETAIQYADEAVKLSRVLKFKNGEAKGLNNIGVVYHLQGEYDKSLKFYNQAAGVYKSASNDRGLANVYSNIASVYQAKSNYTKAMEYYRISLETAKKAGDKQRQAIALGSMGIVYYDQGYYATALECYLESLSLREELNDQQGQAYVLGNIGLIYDAQKRYPLALQYYSRSLRIRQQLEDQFGIATALINIGMVHYALEQYDASLDYFTNALEVSEQSNFNKGIAASLNNIGDVYCELEDYDKALEYLEKALKVNIEMNDAQGTANANHSLGVVYVRTNRTDRALTCFEASLKLAREAGLREIKLKNYKDIADVYAKMGNLSSAFEYQTNYSELKDSIYDEESITRLADMQVKYETEKKEQEIEKLSKEKELQELKINRNNIIFILSGAVFLLLVGLAGALVFSSRQRQKARQLTLERESERAIRESEIKYKELEGMLPQMVMEMEERERKRFAKDLHDGLGPLLSSIKIYVNELQDQETPEAERLEMLRYTNELIDEAVNDTRTIANNLMPSMIADYGLIKALRNFCDKLQASKAINITFMPEVRSQRFDKTLEIILYRVVMEMINNTLKHAGAKNIEIHLFETEQELELNYKDDGKGFDLQQMMNREGKGMGLNNIRNRVQSVNGTCEFRSEPGKGMMALIEIRKEKFDFNSD